MKIIIPTLTAVLLSLASANAQAIILNYDDYTVDGIVAADIMSGSSGIFYDQSSPNPSLDHSDPSSQRDPASSITDDDLFNTFAYSYDSGAYVDLGFSTSIYSGTGNDLAFFVVGSPSLIDFTAVISDAFGNHILVSSDINPYNIELQGNLDVNGTYISHSMVLIDLDDYAADVFGTNPLTSIRFNLGSEFYTPGLSQAPGLSLAGGIHTSAAVVPLPLPIILFGSGLGLLGFLGRRKKPTLLLKL